MSEKENQAGTTAVATQGAGSVKPTEAAKGAMEVAKKDAVRPEVALITRLNKDREATDSLYNVILQLTGGDKLFVDKFVMCCKAQVDKHWKRDPQTKKWTNPFLVIPLNSQLEALYKCASKKVLPDGYNCNLIPYIGRDEKRVDVSIDFKGLIDIAIREGIITDCDAKEVCEGDDFVWSLGEVERWTFDPRKPRGSVCGYCAWAILPNGKKKWSYMSLSEIAEVRKCARTQMIWDKWQGEMSKKTVIRRLFKTLRNSPRLVAMMELDNDTYDLEEGDDGVHQLHRHAAPVRQLTGATAALPAPDAEAEAEPEAAPAEAQDAQVVEPEPVFV